MALTARSGLPLVFQIRGNKSVKIYQQRAISGAERSEWSGEGTNKLVCFQKRLPAGDFIRLLFFTVDIEQLIGAFYSRKALWQQKDVNHHNQGVINKLWEEIAVALGSNSFLSLRSG